MTNSMKSFKGIQPTASSNAKRIAIYVIFDKDGILDGYRKYYLQELRKVTDYILAVVNGELTAESHKELEALTDDYFCRENIGLLTYGWVEGINHISWDKLYEYDELLMLNDSFFGPFFPLQEMFSAMEATDADFYGALKNFEEKKYSHISGRPLKHGWFRGSICYFYIIRNRLLHSPEFRRYWENKPEIKEDWDAYFFNEIDFYDYVIDAGFRTDAYQSDKLKGYYFDNLTHNMEKLIKDDRIPFARIRPFSTDLKDQSMYIHYGKDPRLALEYIDKHTDYDVNLIWDYILRTKNLKDIWSQLQLEYVVPTHSVEKPYIYDKKIAVILHIYYTDLVEQVAAYCENFPEHTDFYITTIYDDTEDLIVKEFSRMNLNFVCKKRPNVGVAMSSLWVTYSDIIIKDEYEYICYFHDKKSPYSEFSIHGEQFAHRSYENLFGTKEVVKNIINLFEDNPRMGVAGAPLVYHDHYFSVAIRSWSVNFKNTIELAKKLDLHVDINPNIVPVAAYGDMLWFRSAALKKAISYGFTYDDFNIPYKHDGLFMHALERIYGFAAQDSGYYFATVINSDFARSDLVNYQYIIYKACEVMLQSGNYPGTFEGFMNSIVGQSQSGRVVLKNAFKKRIPEPAWKAIKKMYHILGGKKWVG